MGTSLGFILAIFHLNPTKVHRKCFSNRIESEGLFRTSGNSRSLFLRFLALVEVFDDFSPLNRIQHVELL